MTTMSFTTSPGKLHQKTIDSADRQEIVFWDQDNPRCVVNMLSEKLKERALELPTNILSLTDEMLEKAVEPTMVHENLRLAFWDEYFVAQDNQKKMRIESIYPRVCSRDYFYRVFIADDLSLAYMMRPPVEYQLKMRSLLELGHRQLEQVLKMKLTNSKGQPDTRLIAEVVKIVALLDNRVKGAVTQKLQIEQKTQVHNHNTYEAPKTMRDIENEINKIDREMQQLSKPERLFDDLEVIEAESTDVGSRKSE
jgi:hypothetical protein